MTIKVIMTPSGVNRIEVVPRKTQVKVVASKTPVAPEMVTLRDEVVATVTQVTAAVDEANQAVEASTQNVQAANQAVNKVQETKAVVVGIRDGLTGIGFETGATDFIIEDGSPSYLFLTPTNDGQKVWLPAGVIAGTGFVVKNKSQSATLYLWDKPSDTKEVGMVLSDMSVAVIYTGEGWEVL